MGLYAILAVAILGLVFALSKKKKQPKTREEKFSIQNDWLTISINTTKYAGAVESLAVRGKEYVNAHDHGRLIQTALQIDGYGECFNPTEAGCYLDVGSNKSSSVLKGVGIDADGKYLETTTQAASWAQSPDGKASCPLGAYSGITVPTDTTISKRVSINQNVITWDVAITCPSAKKEMRSEIVTAYLTADFRRMYSFNPKTKAIQEHTKWTPLNNPGDGYPDGATEQMFSHNEKNPVIMSTEDGQHAIGMIRTSDIKKNEAYAYHVLRYNLDSGVSPLSNSCSKISVLSSGTPKTLTQSPAYQVKLVVGTLDEVRATLSQMV